MASHCIATQASRWHVLTFSTTLRVADGADGGASTDDLSTSVPRLVQRVLDTVRLPDRHDSGNFYFAIDHCFPIRGQV